MEIRRATGPDWAAIRQIYNDVRKRQFLWVDPASISQNDIRRDSEGEEFHVIVEKEKVVGFVSVWAPESFIHHLYIRTASQGKGLGSMLLAFACETYPFPLTLKCVAQNLRAVEFYKKSGWEILEEGISDDGTYFLMELKGSGQDSESNVVDRFDLKRPELFHDRNAE